MGGRHEKPKNKTRGHEKENRNSAAAIEEELNQALAIEEELKQRELQIRIALTEIIDTIENYFTIAPFEWINGPSEELGCKCGFPDDQKTPFNRFDKWFDYWLGQLFPEAHEAQQKLADGTDNGDEPGELAFAAQKLGFLCGVLVGYKKMGRLNM